MAEKVKFAFYMTQEKKQELEQRFREDGSRSMTAFVENAVDFYLDYLHAKDAGAFLPAAVKSVMDGRLGTFEDRISKLLFKLAVATDMNVSVLADVYNFTEDGLRRRRATSVQNVKQTNGILSLEQQARDAGDE